MGEIADLAGQLASMALDFTSIDCRVTLAGLQGLLATVKDFAADDSALVLDCSPSNVTRCEAFPFPFSCNGGRYCQWHRHKPLGCVFDDGELLENENMRLAASHQPSAQC